MKRLVYHTPLSKILAHAPPPPPFQSLGTHCTNSPSRQDSVGPIFLSHVVQLLIVFNPVKKVPIGVWVKGLLIPATILSHNLSGMILINLRLILGPLLLLVQRGPEPTPVGHRGKFQQCFNGTTTLRTCVV